MQGLGTRKIIFQEKFFQIGQSLVSSILTMHEEYSFPGNISGFILKQTHAPEDDNTENEKKNPSGNKSS